MNLDRLLFQAVVNLMDLAGAFTMADEPSLLTSERMFTKIAFTGQLITGYGGSDIDPQYKAHS